jgi:hypothetical protein
LDGLDVCVGFLACDLEHLRVIARGQDGKFAVYVCT